MATAGQWISWTKANPIHIPSFSNSVALKSLHHIFKIRACSTEIDWPRNVNKNTKKPSRSHRRLIRISTAESKWNGSWACDYVFSLKELKLDDLVEDDQKHSKVNISLCIHRHASFGLSVEGKVMTTFARRCSNCYVPYCKEIDTNFNVWVLPSTREKRDNGELPLPEIGGDDPSVIYVKPGYEANLDSLIQDTIRLTLSVKDTCSETCDKATPTFQFVKHKSSKTPTRVHKGRKNLVDDGGFGLGVFRVCVRPHECRQFLSGLRDIGGSNPGKSVDGRWSRLLELRNRSL